MSISYKSVVLILFVLLVLIVGLLLRLEILRGPFQVFYATGGVKDDYYMNYLVAHHIVAYHEYPYIGPSAHAERYIHSPAYFYLLAAPLFVKDGFIVLGVFNIILQLLTLLLVFLLARSLFGDGTAVFAAILFGFHQRVLAHSTWLWQPYAMQPFFVLSCLLLVLAYKKKSFAYLVSGIPVFLFSLALHASVLALAPLYVFFSLAILKNIGGSIRRYAITAATFIIFAGLFYGPLFLHAGQSDFLRYAAPSFMPHFYSWSLAFSNFFLFSNLGRTMPHAPFLFVLAAGVFYYFFNSERDTQRKKFAALLLGSIIWFLVAASFLSPERSPDYYFWYFTSILGLSIIFVAEIIHSLRGYALKAVFIAAMLYFTSSMFFPLLHRVGREFAASGSRFFYISYQSPSFITAIKDEVLKIRKLEQRDDYNFFGFWLYAKGNNNTYGPAGYGRDMFWSSMEMELGAKLTKVDGAADRSYTPLTNAKYIFLACDGAPDTTPCLNAFLKNFPQYKLQKSFFAEPYQIYLTKK